MMASKDSGSSGASGEAPPRIAPAVTRESTGIALGVLEVVRDPVHELVAVAPEALGVHPIG